MPSEKIGKQFDKRANAYNSCEFTATLISESAALISNKRGLGLFQV
jgi:hypothetical protein